MSWSDEYIRDLRSRLAEAKRQGVWVSARDVQFVRHLLSWWLKASMRGWARPGDGPAPTLGSVRRNGVTHLFVSCGRPGCHQSRRLALDDLHRPPDRQPLPDHTVFNDLPNVCRWRCLKCGSRHVTVMAHWPTGAGMGGAHGQLRAVPLAEGKTTWSDDE